MKISCISVLLLVFSSYNVDSQSCTRLLKTALEAGDKKSSQRLKSVDKYAKKCGADLPAFTHYLKAVIFEQCGQYDSAIVCIQSGLDVYKGYEPIQDLYQVCDRMVDIFGEERIFTDYLLVKKMSALYFKKADFKTSLQYLDRINRNSIAGYSGCWNNMIVIETTIALQYADCYIALGDTTAAIGVLTDYALFNEGPPSQVLIHRLKILLDKRFSAQQIEQAIQYSIDHVKEIKVHSPSGFESIQVEYYLFGRKIPFLYYAPAEFKAFISSNQNLLFLRS